MVGTKYYRKGHITVFLSLILTLILSLVCTTIESARLQGVIMQLQNITDMGIFSTFSEYNRDLLELYDLFFLDMGYGTNDGTSERVNMRLKEFTEYNINVNKDLGLLSMFRRADMLRANINEVSTNQYVLATDKNAKAYYSQAVSYMEDKLEISLVQKLLSQYDSSITEKQDIFENYEKSSSLMEADIENKKVEYEVEYDAALEEAKGDLSKVEIEKPREVSNPVNTIKELKNLSILDLVIEDLSNVSNKNIRNQVELPSKRQLKKGDATFQVKTESLFNQVLFNEYLIEKFPNYLSDSSNDNQEGLDYQAEYILCGKKSDKVNLEMVAEKLLLIREGINFSYLLTHRQHEAEVLATAILWYAPALAPVLALLILLAWAFAESVIEVRMLFSGKKVPLLKSSQNWILDLNNLDKLADMLDSGETDEGGLDYEGYLKLITYFSNVKNKTMRSLDLIELTIQSKTNKNFKIDNCTQAFTTTIDYKAEGLFLRLPFKTIERGSKSYRYSITRDFSYY